MDEANTATRQMKIAVRVKQKKPEQKREMSIGNEAKHNGLALVVVVVEVVVEVVVVVLVEMFSFETSRLTLISN